jgi:dTDP-4-dehydrorhamnose reductase
VKILVIGKNSTLAKVYKTKTKIKKTKYISHKELNKVNFKNYSCVINFAINPKLKFEKYDTSLDIDSKITDKININTNYVMISTRFVYQHNMKMPFSEKHKCKPMNFYGKNKLKIEKKLKKKITKNLLVLRLGTLLNFDLSKKHLFTSFLLNNLKKKKTVVIDLRKKIFKDFFTDDFFVKNLDFLIRKKKTGIFNLSSGIPLNPEIIASEIIKGYGKGEIVFKYKNKADKSYLLDNKKLFNVTKLKEKKKKLLNYSQNLGKKLKYA